MLDLISIGTVSIDLYFKGENIAHDGRTFTLDVGKKYNADALFESVGGGGTNVAAAAVAQGLRAGVLGFIGNNPFKEVLLTRLVEKSVSSEFCQFRDDYLNVSSILLTDSGERTIINYRPPYEHLFEGEFNLSALLTSRAFHLGNLPDVPVAERTKLLTFLRKNNREIFFNLGAKDCKRPHEEIDKLIQPADVVILNREEYAMLAGVDPVTLDLKKSVFGAVAVFRGKTVIVTDSKAGSYGYQGETVVFQKADEPDKVVDTTGAGDAYTGAFIAEFLKSKDLKKSMEKGSEYAGHIIGKIGAN